ncbi:MAG: hypothetical protein ACYS8W_00815 [Planctomycetota bacterium]|jgi:hypothetical protein
MITEWIFAIAALIGAIGTLLGTLGYRKKGKKLQHASQKLEKTGRKIADNEKIIRALVVSIEKFRADVKEGHYGIAAGKDLPDIARLIQAFAEEIGIEENLSEFVKSITD